MIQILLDPCTKLPRLEDSDAPLQLFKRSALKAGLHVRELLSWKGEAGPNEELGIEGDFVVLGIAWHSDVLANLLVKPLLHK